MLLYYTPLKPSHYKNIYKSKLFSDITMNKWIEILLGLILVLAPIYDWMANFTGWGLGEAALTFFKGGLVWLLILIGLLFLMLGISDLRE